MHRTWHHLLVCAAAGLIAPAAQAIQPLPTTDSESPKLSVSADSGAAASAREIALRQRLGDAIDLTRRRYLSTDVHTPWQIVHALKAFGRQLELQSGPDGHFVNAVDYLCNDATLRGERVFAPTEHGLKTVRGTGMEGHPNQFLSALAQCGLPLDHPVRVNGRTYSIGDLLAQAKRDYYPGQESHWTLIALLAYEPLDATWTNGSGQVIRIEDLVAAEVAVEPTKAACGGTHNLYALAFALNRYKATGRTPAGVWQQAHAKLERYTALTRSFQNDDGLLSAGFYKGRSSSSDTELQFETTGHMLEWLAIHLSDDDLRQEWVTRAFEALLAVFERTSTQPLDCGSLYHATRALVHYQQRRFGPTNPDQPATPMM